MRMLRGKLLEIKERERMEHMADIKGEMKKSNGVARFAAMFSNPTQWSRIIARGRRPAIFRLLWTATLNRSLTHIL